MKFSMVALMALAGACAVLASGSWQAQAAAATSGSSLTAGQRLFKRFAASNDPHPNIAKSHDFMHSHISKKVFERACKANKDTIDEIVACLHGNEHLMKAIKGEIAGDCYKEAYGVAFDPKETTKHRDMICNNREKFEEMTACAYRKTAEAVDAKEIERLTEALVDVGFCIIDALDS